MICFHIILVARSRWAAALVAAAMGLILAGCDVNKALSVDSPSRIPAGTLETPANAALLVNGAVSDFECAYGAYVVVGGLVGEELDDYTQTASRWPYDRRDVQSNQSMYSVNGCEGLGVYTPLQTARVTANHVRTLLEGWTDADIPAGNNRQVLIATAAAYEAWSILLLGEGLLLDGAHDDRRSQFRVRGRNHEERRVQGRRGSLQRGDHGGAGAGIGRDEHPQHGARRPSARAAGPGQPGGRANRRRARPGQLRVQRHGVVGQRPPQQPRVRRKQRIGRARRSARGIAR